jgi:hypothetical protein
VSRVFHSCLGSVLVSVDCAEYEKKILATLSQDLVRKHGSGYGKKIVTTLPSQLVKKCGQAFDIHNIRRIVRFAENYWFTNCVASGDTI